MSAARLLRGGSCRLSGTCEGTGGNHYTPLLSDIQMIYELLFLVSGKHRCQVKHAQVFTPTQSLSEFRFRAEKWKESDFCINLDFHLAVSNGFHTTYCAGNMLLFLYLKLVTVSGLAYSICFIVIL